MNLVSTLLGLSVMGIAVLDMSIAPLIAQKRAINFGSAESAAVVFAAANQGATQVGNPPDGCQLDNGTNAPAREITCTHGRSKFAQTVSRSFLLEQQSTPPVTPGRTFDYPYPTLGFTTTECHTGEDWGINTNAFDRATNTWTGKSCEPYETRAEAWYTLSNVEAWRYDIHKINGFGPHSGY